MPRYFLHSCSKIQARREKDLTSEMRLNSAKNVRLKKQDAICATPICFLVAYYATLHHSMLSVGWLVGWLVGWSPFYFFGVFELLELTSPAQML